MKSSLSLRLWVAPFDRTSLKVAVGSSPFRQSDWRSLVLRRGKSRRLRSQQVGSQQRAPVGPLAHLLLRFGGNKVFAFANLPAAAQSPVRCNQSERDASRSEDEIILRLIKVLLRGENGGEIGNAFAVLEHRNSQGPFSRADALSQKICLLPRVNKC